MSKYLKNFRKMNTFLQGGVVTGLSFALLVLAYFLFITQKPEPFDDVISQVEATLEFVNAGNQRGGGFTVKVNPGQRLVKFITLPTYTSITGDIRQRVGKKIVINHYSGVVVSCSIDGVVFCTPKCNTHYECQLNIFNSDAATIRWVAYTFLILCMLCFFSYFINKKREW